jgi:hypothetical protein
MGMHSDGRVQKIASVVESKRNDSELLSRIWKCGQPWRLHEGIMRARGFSMDFMVERIVRSGLAIATAAYVPIVIEPARMRITDAPRQALRR